MKLKIHDGNRATLIYQSRELKYGTIISVATGIGVFILAIYVMTEQLGLESLLFGLSLLFLIPGVLFLRQSTLLEINRQQEKIFKYMYLFGLLKIKTKEWPLEKVKGISTRRIEVETRYEEDPRYAEKYYHQLLLRTKDTYDKALKIAEGVKYENCLKHMKEFLKGKVKEPETIKN